MRIQLLPLLLSLVSILAACQTTQQKQVEALQELSQSHIVANVPNSEARFFELLKRDLTTYFSDKLGKAQLTVESDLLRRAPTQSGVAYPKYYAWVKVKDPTGITVTTGAVRLAAIAQERFEITDFIDAAEIWRDPAAPRRVFPAALCDAIVARAAPARSSSP